MCLDFHVELLLTSSSLIHLKSFLPDVIRIYIDLFSKGANQFFQCHLFSCHISVIPLESYILAISWDSLYSDH